MSHHGRVKYRVSGAFQRKPKLINLALKETPGVVQSPEIQRIVGTLLLNIYDLDDMWMMAVIRFTGMTSLSWPWNPSTEFTSTSGCRELRLCLRTDCVSNSHEEMQEKEQMMGAEGAAYLMRSTCRA